MSENQAEKESHGQSGDKIVEYKKAALLSSFLYLYSFFTEV
jgi:hypothetical protein